MTEVLTVVVVLFVVGVVLFAARRWRRRQKGARLADVLLSDVLKAKDSYRR